MNSQKIVIVGSGVVGLLAANLLARTKSNQVQVVAPLVEDKHPNTSQKLRFSAINLASKALLAKCISWEQLPKQAMHNINIFDQNFAELNFNNYKLGHNELGYIVNNYVLETQLLAQAKTIANIELIDAKLSAIDAAQNLITIKTKHSQSENLAYDLLLATDGAKSLVRQLLNVGIYVHNYRQTAIVATLQSSFAHKNVAWQRFTADSVIGFLPLVEARQYSIVLSSNNSAYYMGLNEAQFGAKLSALLGARVGPLELVSSRLTFPLMMQHAHNYTIKNVVFMGDSAHTVHPLAGQGLNLGINDINLFLGALATHDYSLKAYYAYQVVAKAYNAKIMHGINLIKALYKPGVIDLPRSLGLYIISSSNLLKANLARYALYG